jgi:FMN phosphatase YigB (HAD superfamily)
MIIIFDLDNTLIRNPFSSGVFPHLEWVLNQKGPKKDYTRLFFLEAARLRHARNFLESYDWDLIVNRIASANGIKVHIDVEQLVRKFSVAPYVSLEPGANDLLTALHRRGHKNLILSNGYAKYQTPVIESLGLKHYDALITSEKIGFIKPQPEAFRIAAEPFLSDDSTKTIVVGDSVFYDVWGGANAGFQPVWIARHERLATQPVQLSRLEDLIRDSAEREGLESLVKEIPNIIVFKVHDLREAEGCISQIESSSGNELRLL